MSIRPDHTSSYTSARASLLTLVAAVFLSLLICVTAGCRRVNNVVWSKYTALPESGWDPVNVIPFFPWPEDSVVGPSDSYSLLLSVRFTSLRDSSRMHVAIHQEDETGFYTSDTLSLLIAPPPNRPIGRGAYGVYETVDTVCRGLKLRPGYTVELQSLSAPENTTGILDIGLILMQENAEEESIFQRIVNKKFKLQ